MKNSANNGMILVPLVNEGALMTTFFYVNWDDRKTIFENILDVRNELVERRTEFPDIYHNFLLKQIEDLDFAAEEYDFGFLTAEEIEEKIKEQIKFLNNTLKKPISSNVIPFPRSHYTIPRCRFGKNGHP
jgi:hypothetical protein